MRLNKLILPLMLIPMGLLSFSSPTIDGKEGKPRGTLIDTTSVFFLDGKRISGTSVLLMLHEKKVTIKAGDGSSKTAIFRFGEQARNGIYVFETIENKKEK
jgi:hypothetical protein